MIQSVSRDDREQIRHAMILYKSGDLVGLFDLAVAGIDLTDDARSWRLLAKALRRMRRRRPAHCDAWLGTQLGLDVTTTGCPDLALWAFRVAWERSGKTDEVSRREMDELRAEIGYHREDWCWNCREYLSDALFDNAGRCAWARFDCLLCRSCGSHRCQAPYRRAD